MNVPTMTVHGGIAKPTSILKQNSLKGNAVSLHFHNSNYQAESTPMLTKLIVKCAWCGKYLGVKDGKGVSGISHGICKECADKLTIVK